MQVYKFLIGLVIFKNLFIIKCNNNYSCFKMFKSISNTTIDFVCNYAGLKSVFTNLLIVGWVLSFKWLISCLGSKG